MRQGFAAQTHQIQQQGTEFCNKFRQFRQDLHQQGEQIQGLQQCLTELEWTVAAVAPGQPVVRVEGMPVVAAPAIPNAATLASIWSLSSNHRAHRNSKLFALPWGLNLHP